MSRFLDSSVFLHSILRPKRPLTPSEREIKECAKEIVRRLDEGAEEFVTSVVHLSEILNILESRSGLSTALKVLETFLSLDNLEIVDVSLGDYQQALVVSERYGVSPNDSLAAVLMRKLSLEEIYSFDRHFDSIPWVRRIACETGEVRGGDKGS